MKKIKLRNILKPFLSALSLSALISCAEDALIHGKITPYNGGDKNAFSFLVDEQYLEKNQNSKKSKDYPQMSEAEVKLLKNLLQKQNYCKNSAFVITSRQEKIYDVTFSHLIEQNYKAKPIAPRTYFGQCL